MSVAPNIIIIPKVISSSIGCDYSVATKSTSISPPSLCSSLLCVSDSMPPFNFDKTSLDVASPFGRFLGAALTTPHLFGRIQTPFG